MKEDIRNIINFENLTKVRNSINVGNSLPAVNSIVNLVPIEYMDKGVKVLIDGKLFIAFIEERIQPKEEILAIVKSTNPFSLSLNLKSSLLRFENPFAKLVLKKLNLPSTTLYKNIVNQVIEEGKILIRSKLVSLENLLQKIKPTGMEYTLLIDLIWHNDENDQEYIEDLYYNLFDEKFKDVCEKLAVAINELLFSEIPQHIVHEINNSLIYSEREKCEKAILNKVNTIIEIIKMLNEIGDKSILNRKSIDAFIYYGTKYVMQKSVLKDYDYYPDFVIVNTGKSNSIIHYGIKKYYGTNNEVYYKLSFLSNQFPVKLSGFIKERLMIGEVEMENYNSFDEYIKPFEEMLWDKHGFRSDIKSKNNNIVVMPNLDIKINKLVS